MKPDHASPAFSSPAAGRRASRRGVTLLELLAALTVSAVAVVLAARVLFDSQARFLLRVRESELLHAQYLLDQTVRAHLRADILGCAGRDLAVRDGDSTGHVFARLREEHPGLLSLRFICYERNGQSGELVSWSGSGRPDLIEYEWELGHRDLRRAYRGSWLP